MTWASISWALQQSFVRVTPRGANKLGPQSQDDDTEAALVSDQEIEHTVVRDFCGF